MKRTWIRLGLVAVIAAIAVLAPRPAKASAARMCNVPSGGHILCSDWGYIEYWCNYQCPGWTLAVCTDGTIVCSKDPD